MLEQLILKNVQAYTELRIEFDPFITTFVGPNDIGKSTIIRALRWICLNQPPGDDLIRWDTDRAYAKLVVDGHSILRRKGKEINTYAIDGKVLKSFRNEVPQEITQLLNVDEVNFQEQLEPQFWFFLTPGQISKELNRIISLGAIDTCLSNTASELRRAKSTREVSESRLESLRLQKSELDWAVDADKDLQEVEAKYQHFEDKLSQADGLRVLISQVQQYQNLKRTLGEARTEGQFLVSSGVNLHKKTQRVEELRKLIKESEKSLVYKKTPIPNIEEVESLLNKYQDIESKRQDLAQYLDKYISWQETKLESDKWLKINEKKLSQLKTCPMCGSLLSAVPASTCPQKHQ